MFKLHFIVIHQVDAKLWVFSRVRERERVALRWVWWPGCSSWRPEREKRCSPAQGSCQACTAPSGWSHTCRSELFTKRKNIGIPCITTIQNNSYNSRIQSMSWLYPQWNTNHLAGTASQPVGNGWADQAPQTSCNPGFHCGTCDTFISQSTKTSYIWSHVCYGVMIQMWNKRSGTSAPAGRYSECSWRTLPGQPSSVGWPHGCPGYRQSEMEGEQIQQAYCRRIHFISWEVDAVHYAFIKFPVPSLIMWWRLYGAWQWL